MSKIITIDGVIEVLGNHIIAPGGVRYKFIRFLTADNRVVMLKNIAVGDDMYSYLQPGLRGRFCYYRHGAGADVSFLGDLAISVNFMLGIHTGNRLVVESDRKLIVLIRIINGCFMAFAAVASIIVIGIPWLIVSVISLFTPTPSKEEVYRTLASYKGM